MTGLHRGLGGPRTDVTEVAQTEHRSLTTLQSKSPPQKDPGTTVPEGWELDDVVQIAWHLGCVQFEPGCLALSGQKPALGDAPPCLPAGLWCWKFPHIVGLLQFNFIITLSF